MSVDASKEIGHGNRPPPLRGVHCNDLRARLRQIIDIVQQWRNAHIRVDEVPLDKANYGGVGC